MKALGNGQLGQAAEGNRHLLNESMKNNKHPRNLETLLSSTPEIGIDELNMH